MVNDMPSLIWKPPLPLATIHWKLTSKPSGRPAGIAAGMPPAPPASGMPPPIGPKKGGPSRKPLPPSAKTAGHSCAPPKGTGPTFQNRPATVPGVGSAPAMPRNSGPLGVVKVLDDKTLIFPIYDGNGMFLSAGNAADTGKVGLLFIDFETPNRVRVQGDATVSSDDPELARWPGAKMVVRVAVESCFLNCARYIHKHARVEASPYVPKDDGSQPHPSWKRIDFVQEALSEDDQARTRATGEITMDDYIDHLMEGRS